MAGSFSVQYIFRLVDQFSGPSRNLARAAQAISKPVHAAGAAANAAAAGLARYGQAAAAAAAKVGALAKAQVAAFAGPGGIFGRRGRRGDGGGLGVLGLMGGAWWGKGILDVGKEASAAENKFRSLVDSVTEQQMSALRASISSQMKKTGETYADLMSAAGDAAQIVGSADMATNIMKAASSLAQIDTAGKDTAYFAETLAAIIGPNGTLADLTKLANMLAAQQKLGAATAGGTIEAYKNVAAMKEFSGADQVALMTTIGLIKNFMPALNDSEIGNMAKYGLRLMTMPKAVDLKSMGFLGLKPKDFLGADGAFDVAKTQAMLYEISKQAGGLDKLKKAFSGRNVLAGQFWLSMLRMEPEKFAAYYKSLIDSAGQLDKAVEQRTKGMEGAMNRLGGVYQDFKRGLAKFVEPVVLPAMDFLGGSLSNLIAFGKWLTKTSPLVSKLVASFLVFGGVLAAAALPLALLATSLRALGAGYAVSALGGLFKGIAGGVSGLARAFSWAHRFAGALGALKLLGRMALRLTLIGVGFAAVSWVYDNWSRLKELAKDPIKVDILFPEVPEPIRQFMAFMAGAGSQAGKNAEGGLPGNVSPDGIAGLYRWFTDPFGVMREWYNTFGQQAVPAVPNLPAMPQPPSGPHGKFGPGFAPTPDSSGGIAAAEGQREISVRTSVDPITITPTTANVNVTVTGTVNGPVNGTGSGSMPLSASAPRGRASATPPAAPVAP